MSGKIGLISLGCPKNMVDSERMLSYLKNEGWEFTSDPGKSDVIIINTCGFIVPAREEAINTILEAAELKKQGLKRLVVAGCMVNRYKEELSEEIPEIDAFVDTHSLEKIIEAVLYEPAPHEKSHSSGSRELLTPPHYAYLKIGDGCNHKCAFCTIPIIKGDRLSRSPTDILSEAEALAEKGVREIILISQDSSGWGGDIRSKSTLAELLAKMDKEGLFVWIRVMYLYPSEVDDNLISAFAECSSVLPYFDIPFQHSHPDILKRMLRPGNGDTYLKLIEKIRKNIPDAIFRSGFIVGYPGETDATVKHLSEFIVESRILNAGVFTYWHEEGTSAYTKYQDTISQEQKDAWMAELMETQKAVSRCELEKYTGKELDVIIDGFHPESELLVSGRFYGQAPEIDGTVIITDGNPEFGKIQKVLIEESHDYDLVGKVV